MLHQLLCSYLKINPALLPSKKIQMWPRRTGLRQILRVEPGPTARALTLGTRQCGPGGRCLLLVLMRVLVLMLVGMQSRLRPVY
jgi:hypothetical protein